LTPFTVMTELVTVISVPFTIGPSGFKFAINQIVLPAGIDSPLNLAEITPSGQLLAGALKTNVMVAPCS
jgi:hypothetical protein